MSGPILAILVGAWAVVLFPMWLNRHDAASETRSVDRFSTAMRSLSGRGASRPDQRYVVMPQRDVRGATVDNHRAASRGPVRSSGGPSLSLVARRRRVTLVLLGAVALTLLLAVVGVLPMLALWPVDLLFVGYVVHLRIQAKRAAELRRRRGARAGVAAAARAAAPGRPPGRLVGPRDLPWSGAHRAPLGGRPCRLAPGGPALTWSAGEGPTSPHRPRPA